GAATSPGASQRPSRMRAEPMAGPIPRGSTRAASARAARAPAARRSASRVSVSFSTTYALKSMTAPSFLGRPAEPGGHPVRSGPPGPVPGSELLRDQHQTQRRRILAVEPPEEVVGDPGDDAHGVLAVKGQAHPHRPAPPPAPLHHGGGHRAELTMDRVGEHDLTGDARVT